MNKKLTVAASIFLGVGLFSGQVFAKEDSHEKEHHKVKYHHEKKELHKSQTTTNSNNNPTTSNTSTSTSNTTSTPPVTTPSTTISNPITGFAVTLGIPGGFDTSVKLVSVMWAKGLAFSYNVFVDGVKVKTVLDSQGITFMEYQQVMVKGVHTIGISIVDQNGNESQQCVKTVNVQ